MAEAKGSLPSFKYTEGKRLPDVVDRVIKDIQKHMMDDMRDTRRPRTLPNMPKEFLCSEVTTEKEKMMDFAGEDVANDQELDCYQIFIPFFIRPYDMSTEYPSFVWSGNVISFCKMSDSNSEFVVVEIKGNLAKVKNYHTGQRDLKFFAISSDMEELPSKPLKKFLGSPLVVKQSSGHVLISSYKMTISWLRSRLHKALNLYREKKKDMDVIGTIKQKDGGPLFLRLHIEENEDVVDAKTKYDLLFALCPAFRVSPCQLAVPVISKLDDVPPKFEGEEKLNKQYLWRIIPKCNEEPTSHKHKKAPVMNVYYRFQLSNTNVEKNEEAEKTKTDEKTLYKKSIDKVRQMTTSQSQECQQCRNPASRMLLEYYYQYGYISDEDMNESASFVWEILNFLKKSIEEARKPNDPAILKFVESGSVSEKLKVIQPDEFDVMIEIDMPEIDMPESTKSYTFVEHESFPTGFAICQVKRSKSFSRELKRCIRESAEFKHCLAPEQLAFGWLYGKLERAINKYRALSKGQVKASLKLRRGGPALLLEITPNETTQTESKLPRVISVDLVLALKLSKDDSRYAVAKRATEEHFYKMVAKNLKSSSEDGEPNSQFSLPVTSMTDCEKEKVENVTCNHKGKTNTATVLVQDENMNSTSENSQPYSQSSSPVTDIDDAEDEKMENPTSSEKGKTNTPRILVQDEDYKSFRDSSQPNFLSSSPVTSIDDVEEEKLNNYPFSHEGKTNTPRILVQDEDLKSSSDNSQLTFQSNSPVTDIVDAEGEKLNKCPSFMEGKTNTPRNLVQTEDLKSSMGNTQTAFHSSSPITDMVVAAEEKLEKCSSFPKGKTSTPRMLVQDEDLKLSGGNDQPNTKANSPVVNMTHESEKETAENAGCLPECDGTITSRVTLQGEMKSGDMKELARKNLKYLWRISYSAQEKIYLEYIKEIQREKGVKGCQNVCLMVLKTICSREILKQEDSAICHKLSSYILKTALFHVLAKTDLVQDWEMDCLADRYIDLLDELSNWKHLPHFFYNNASCLREVFPNDDWCEQTSSKNLLDELHATLKIQLYDRFAEISKSFKKCKKKIDEKLKIEEKDFRSSQERFGYHEFLSDVLKSLSPEKVIHPLFWNILRLKKRTKSRSYLIAEQDEDIRVGKAAKADRKSGPRSDPRRNLQMSETVMKEEEKNSRWLRDVDFHDQVERNVDMPTNTSESSDDSEEFEIWKYL